VIFATVGSHPTFRFDRLLQALETLGDGEELAVQHGPGTPPANASVAVPWMSFEGIADNLARADKVVCHAGVGTILCAIRAGHVPVVFPRLSRFNETVDDHQLHLAKALVETNKVILVEEGSELAAALAKAPARGEAGQDGGGALIGAVRDELLQSSPR
jgi:UDP-N-acetylglucosamine--N-acetylmuramyl-(pentapeptide) pyrophosphoryl-undecaprenol N-acetylglucosamine transferase